MKNIQIIHDEIIEFIKDYYNKNNLKGAILGISGGKDSAVVAALFAEALGRENVIGMWLPCHSKKEDYNDAKLLSNFLGIQLIEYDLTKIYDDFVAKIKVDPKNLVDANINIKPRLRMSTLYYHAAMYSALNNGVYLVPGTSNKCELYVGYFTKGGDSVSDIITLGDLTVDEVIKIGKELKVPEKVLYKTPDDGLSGLTDEEKLGVKYNDIAKVINGEEVDKEIKKKIQKLHKANQHKLHIPKYKKKRENNNDKNNYR